MARERVFQYDETDGVLTVNVKVETEVPTIEASIGGIPPIIQDRITMYGLKQVLADSASGWRESGSDPGKMVQAKLASLMEGNWTERRGDGTPSVTARVIAYQRFVQNKKGVEVPLDKVKEAWSKFSRKQQNAIAKHPDFKPILDEVKAEIEAKKPAKAEISLEEMLGGFQEEEG